MTLVGVASIMSAVAFVVLVVVIVWNLLKVGEILTDLKETVTRLNTTIDVVTKDVDNLSVEVEALLNKTNTLVDDVNFKLKKTDPLFTAIGDVGESVSELNSSTKNMTTNLLSGVRHKKTSALQSVMRVVGSRKPKKEHKVAPLEDVTKTTPSKTAGEIKIN